MKRGSWSSRETNWRAGLSVSPRVGSSGRKLPDNVRRLEGCGSGSIVIDGVPVVEYLRNLRARCGRVMMSALHDAGLGWI